MVLDTLDLAMDAGLRYVEPGAAGFRRVKRGRGFSYVSGSGQPAGDQRRRWIEDLVIPPAWEDVWISKDPKGHILVTGLDKAGRKQYIYHPDWERIRDEVKFDRLGDFGERLPALRRRVDSDLRTRGLSRDRIVALAIAVLDRTLIRVGNRRYSDRNESYGLTTLRCDHIEVEGCHVQLEFAGKGGSDRQVIFSDRRLSTLVARCQELSGQTLFSYETEEEGSASVTSSDVNHYLSEAMGEKFTAKDYRTWGASSQTCSLLSASSEAPDSVQLRAAVETVASTLGNTPAVCRSSYLHPAVVEAYEDGALADAWRRARPGKWVERPESALRLLLARPEG
jgi:DNA topoisomerase-1